MKYKVGLLAVICLVGAHHLAAESLDDNTKEEGMPYRPRLDQSVNDSPSAVSKLTREKIYWLGFNTLEETMRSFVGTRVAFGTSRLPYIHNHGTNGGQNRMEVSIDGHDLGEQLRHQSKWDYIILDQIEEIEYKRSPSGTSNSYSGMMGSLNFETIKPGQMHPFTLKAGIGSRNSTLLGMSFSKEVYSGLEFSASYQKETNDGLDDSEENGERVDYLDSESVGLAAEALFGETSVHSTFRYFNLEKGSSIPITDRDPPGDDNVDPIFKTYYQLGVRAIHPFDEKNILTLSGNVSRLSTEQSYATCNYAYLYSPKLGELADKNPALALFHSGLVEEYDGEVTARDQAMIDAFELEQQEKGIERGDYLCSSTSQEIDLRRDAFSVGYANSYDLDKSLGEIRSFLGVDVAEEFLESLHYINGEARKLSSSLRAQSEIKIQDFTVNLAANFQNGNQVSESASALRTSINYHITNFSTVRLGYSQGLRQPSLIEGNLDWGYTGLVVSDANPYGGDYVDFFYRSRLNAEPETERSESYELSFYHHNNDKEVELDAKLFYDHLTNLVDDNLTFTQPDIGYNTTSKLSGFEIDITKTFEDISTEMRFMYSYIHYDLESGAKRGNVLNPEEVLAAPHQGAIQGIYKVNDNQVMTLAYYHQSAFINSDSKPYQRFDAVYSKEWGFGETALRFQVRYSHYFQTVFSVKGYNLPAGKSSLAQKNEYYFKFSADL